MTLAGTCVSILSTVLIAAGPPQVRAAGPAAGAETSFVLAFDGRGLTELRRAGDAFDTNYLAAGAALGDLLVSYRMENGRWQTVRAFGMGDVTPPRSKGPNGETAYSFFDRYYMYHADFNDHYADLEITETFRPEGEALLWIIRLRNLSDKPMTVGDLALALPFNTEGRWDREETFTRRVLQHAFVSGQGSFLYWMRPNSVGPYLVMTPVAQPPSGTAAAGFLPAGLEYFDDRGWFIHSAAAGEEVRRIGGNWRQAHTDLTLGPRGAADAEATYAFAFRWADGYPGVRDVLRDHGLADIEVVPGMVVPSDLTARFAVRSRAALEKVAPEFPDATRLEDLGPGPGGRRLFEVAFSRLGENRLTLSFRDGRSMLLEFFASEPLDTMIRKRAAFLARNQQHRDPSLWYDGLFSDWDMRTGVLRGPDDTDDLKDYWLASDDPGLAMAPYLSQKNLHYPDRNEIAALEYHIRSFVWGKLQRTDREKYPYGIYGIPNWKVNRESGPGDRRGWIYHLWRVYDYPHIIMLYLNMARIARHEPDLVKDLDHAGYLARAYGTAMAYFTLPSELGRWRTDDLGVFNELVIVDLLRELEAAGRRSEAGRLRAEWEAKVRRFVQDEPNYFHAEYPFGPCAFESTQAFAAYALDRLREPGSTLPVTRVEAEAFMEEQIRANIAMRGWLEPAYYLLGSSRPGSLFYMTQMGGWGVMDYALRFAAEPAPFLRLGYASFLAGWALLNSGPAASGYGYWYPGAHNDGATSSAFVQRAFHHEHGKALARGVWFYGGEGDMGYSAALRTACTVAAEDPIFGPVALGGTRTRTAGRTEVVPRDGLRQRFHVLRPGLRASLLLDRDGFKAEAPIAFDDDLGTIDFVLEDRSERPHRTGLEISGLPAGAYELLSDGRRIAAFTSGPEARTTIEIPASGGADRTVAIRRTGRDNAPPSTTASGRAPAGTGGKS